MKVNLYPVFFAFFFSLLVTACRERKHRAEDVLRALKIVESGKKEFLAIPYLCDHEIIAAKNFLHAAFPLSSDINHQSHIEIIQRSNNSLFSLPAYVPQNKSEDYASLLTLSRFPFITELSSWIRDVSCGSEFRSKIKKSEGYNKSNPTYDAWNGHGDVYSVLLPLRGKAHLFYNEPVWNESTSSTMPAPIPNGYVVIFRNVHIDCTATFFGAKTAVYSKPDSKEYAAIYFAARLHNPCLKT